MRRALWSAALFVAAVAPAAAQLSGMPVWNSPKGGTGIMIAGDYGLPSDDAGGGSAFGAHASIGFSRLTIGAGVASWKPDGASDALTSYGGGLAIRLIGGTLIPLNVNVFGGGAQTQDVSFGLGTADLTTLVAGAGVSATLPIPGFSLEPYLSVSNRWNTFTGIDTESDIGWTLGANATFGMFGAHVAYDSQDFGGTTRGVLGLGVHVKIGVPGL